MSRYGNDGEWYVSPEEWPNSPKADYIHKVLSECQVDEPDANNRLQTRGLSMGWHDMAI